MSCTVQKWDAIGRLTVTLSSDRDVVAHATTAAFFNWVRVRSDGPWGEARGLRGDQRILRFRLERRRDDAGMPPGD